MMDSETIGIAFSCYNNGATAARCLQTCLRQNYPNIFISVADDGSRDDTLEQLRGAAAGDGRVDILALPHGERGIARKKAIDALSDRNCRYLLFIDSDMELLPGMLQACVDDMKNHPETGALIIPEIPWSESRNFFTKVKIFERTILNNAGRSPGKNSIEAARFWKLEAYRESGGINPQQISFEETQPSIRYLESGGKIYRVQNTGLKHNEGYVNLSNILKKKSSYFGAMNSTLKSESKGFLKALQRWYFFRPVLYRPSNIIQYFRHPLLSAGMFFMYVALSFIGLKVLFVVGK